MRCNSAITSLSPFLDGQLPPDRLADLDRHLQDCPACMAELSALRAADAVAQFALPEEPLSPTFVSDLERRIAREGDTPAPTGGLTVRAIIPMAAAVLLGATVTFLGMHLGRRGPGTADAPPADGGLVGFPELRTLEHEPIAADREEAAAHAAADGFAARADVLLTNLGHLSARDATRELAMVRNETDAVGLEPAMKTAHASVDVLVQRDPIRALRLENALEGTSAVLKRLQADGAADQKLFGARHEMLTRELRRVIDELAPDGLPRPRRAGGPADAAPDVNDPAAVWRAAFKQYSDGNVHEATALFQKVAALATHRDEKGRASYWIAKSSLLDGKPHLTLKQLPQVKKFSPGAAADLSRQMGFVVTAGGGTVIIQEADGEVRMLIKGDIEPGAPFEVEVDTTTVHADHKRDMAQFRKKILDRQRRMKAEFERMSKSERSDVRQTFEAGRLPKPSTSHYFFRTTAIRVDGVEVPLDGASKVLRDTAPIIAYRIQTMRARRVTTSTDSGSQIFSFDVWDREEDTTRKASRRVQFGSWEAQQFIGALQTSLGRTLIDEQGFSTFQTIEFVVEKPDRAKVRKRESDR